MLKILYFGRLTNSANRREDSLALPANITTLSALKNWLDSHHDLDGALGDPSIKTMINQAFVHGDAALTGDEEIGFLPPVGGG